MYKDDVSCTRLNSLKLSWSAKAQLQGRTDWKTPKRIHEITNINETSLNASKESLAPGGEGPEDK